MKKFILPLLLILAVGMLAAVESEPSEVVGYFKKNIGDGQWQAISLPFFYSSLIVGDVLGNQFSELDAVQDVNTGASTIYYADFGWFGDVENLSYGTAYFINRSLGNGATDYFLLGKVDPQGFTKTIVGNGAFTAFGLNEATEIELSDDLFGTNESDGDVIQDINTGASSIYYSGFGWFGDLTQISPTVGYYYNSALGSSDFVWTYEPTRGVVRVDQTINKKQKQGSKK